MAYLMKLKLAACVTICALAYVAVASDHECPADRPYPRGSDACDSCPWEETLALYKSGELSETRKSQVFDHHIRVSVVCDVDRPVDVDDVFSKVEETERTVERLFPGSIERLDGLNQEGEPKILEVVTGICDYGGSVDDCVMYTVCASGPRRGCDVSSGQAFANADDNSTHITFVPWLAENDWWWTPGNRYGNLQHEFTHLLDYTYFRVHGERGHDLSWWVEGFPQFIQNQILNDSLSWRRGNDSAYLLGIFTHRDNTSDYYDGMRVVWYLSERAPWLMHGIAAGIREGIYRGPRSHLAWHDLMGYIAARHQDDYEQYITTTGARSSRASFSSDDHTVRGFTDAPQMPTRMGSQTRP